MQAKQTSDPSANIIEFIHPGYFIQYPAINSYPATHWSHSLVGPIRYGSTHDKQPVVLHVKQKFTTFLHD